MSKKEKERMKKRIRLYPKDEEFEKASYFEKPERPQSLKKKRKAKETSKNSKRF